VCALKQAMLVEDNRI